MTEHAAASPPLDPRDALAAVQHDVRGVAATLGALARLLIDRRLPPADETALIQRLARLASRLEELAVDAGTLEQWIAGGTPVTWQVRPLEPILTSIFGDGDLAIEYAGRDRAAMIRIADGGSFERALGALKQVAARESGAGWRAAIGDLTCELASSAAAAAKDRESWPRPRTAATLAALVVLEAHGVSVWRGRAGEGLGLSISLVRSAASAG